MIIRKGMVQNESMQDKHKRNDVVVIKDTGEIGVVNYYSSMICGRYDITTINEEGNLIDRFVHERKVIKIGEI